MSSGRKGMIIRILLLTFCLFGCFFVKNERAMASEQEKNTVMVGWQKIGHYTYYFDKDGKKVTGLKKIEGKYYYFSKKGIRKTGWRKVKGVKYYFDPNKNGSRAKGWTNIGNYKYYFSKGLPKTGWLKKSGKVYYLNAKGRVVTGWKTIDGKKYYFLKPSGERAVGVVEINGTEYAFNSDGVIVTSGFYKGYFADSTGHRLEKATIRKLLQTALKPVGSTLYIWGGGWNKSADGSITGRTMGVSPAWKSWFNANGKDYDYTKYRYEYPKGLDCSGYIGWVIYNTFNSTSGHGSFVMLAQVMAKTFAGYGWGTYKPAGSVTDFKAGDIMSLAAGHVYMVVGQCSDGSVVLLHSSPPGVMITGTATRSGNKKSEAIKLANYYMKKYFPAFNKKFPDTSRDASYLTNYAQMRWYAGRTTSLITDPEGLRNMDAKQVLTNLLGP